MYLELLKHGNFHQVEREVKLKNTSWLADWQFGRINCRSPEKLICESLKILIGAQFIFVLNITFYLFMRYHCKI
jgi:hypothetical protein